MVLKSLTSAEIDQLRGLSFGGHLQHFSLFGQESLRHGHRELAVLQGRRVAVAESPAPIST
jgi:hypothetical protein